MRGVFMHAQKFISSCDSVQTAYWDCRRIL